MSPTNCNPATQVSLLSFHPAKHIAPYPIPPLSSYSHLSCLPNRNTQFSYSVYTTATLIIVLNNLNLTAEYIPELTKPNPIAEYILVLTTLNHTAVHILVLTTLNHTAVHILVLTTLNPTAVHILVLTTLNLTATHTRTYRDLLVATGSPLPLRLCAANYSIAVSNQGDARRGTRIFDRTTFQHSGIRSVASCHKTRDLICCSIE